jgi:hypothetical protein
MRGHPPRARRANHEPMRSLWRPCGHSTMCITATALSFIGTTCSLSTLAKLSVPKFTNGMTAPAEIPCTPCAQAMCLHAV